MITAGPRNRIEPQGPVGPPGPQGPKGDTGDSGDDGLSPEYQWRGTEIRFRKPDGSWGKWVDLKGERGPIGLGMVGPQGPPASLEEFSTDASTNPGDAVVLTGPDFVTTIADNMITTMPHGILGFVAYKSSSTLAAIISVGKLTGLSGLTPAAAYFISVSGGLTTTPPATGMVQQVGFAMNATTMYVNLMQPMRRS